MKKFWLVFMGLGISLYSFSQIETDEEIVDTDTIEITLSDTIDNAIVYPESMEADLNNLLTDWYMQQYAVVDDSCLVNSVNVDYPDSVYIRKLSQLPTVIEMPYNSVVRRYIDMYVQKRRALVENLLGLSTYYMPIFEEALEREGLPLELKSAYYRVCFASRCYFSGRSGRFVAVHGQDRKEYGIGGEQPRR